MTGLDEKTRSVQRLELFAITLGSTAGETDMGDSRLSKFVVQFYQVPFDELSDLSLSLLGEDGNVFKLSHL